MTFAERWTRSIDCRVLAALDVVPDSQPLEWVAAIALVPMADLRAAMTRLCLQDTEHLPTEDMA